MALAAVPQAGQPSRRPAVPRFPPPRGRSGGFTSSGARFQGSPGGRSLASLFLDPGRHQRSPRRRPQGAGPCPKGPCRPQSGCSRQAESSALWLRGAAPGEVGETAEGHQLPEGPGEVFPRAPPALAGPGCGAASPCDRRRVPQESGLCGAWCWGKPQHRPLRVVGEGPGVGIYCTLNVPISGSVARSCG